MLSSWRGVGMMEELLIIGGLVGVQIIYAVYMVVLTRVLALGLDPIFLVAAGSLANALLLFPLAVAFERSKWPTKLKPILMLQLVLIAFGGVTIFQGLMLLGIRKTSPAVASAMPNLTPGLIFIIAACFRFEKFEISCKYTRAKILGTLVCLSGAIAMSFLQSPPVPVSPTLSNTFGQNNKDWIIGCFYLLVAVVVFSCTMVLQAATMVDFPAPFSLCVITSLIGSILTGLMQIIIEGKLTIGSPSINIASMVAIMLVGGVVYGVCIAFQAWCVKRKGPVMVSIFCPVQTVFSAILCAIFLRQFLTLGSLAGMLLMFGGLYIVLWAKKKEGCTILIAGDIANQPINDIEKPILS